MQLGRSSQAGWLLANAPAATGTASFTNLPTLRRRQTFFRQRCRRGFTQIVKNFVGRASAELWEVCLDDVGRMCESMRLTSLRGLRVACRLFVPLRSCNCRVHEAKR